MFNSDRCISIKQAFKQYYSAISNMLLQLLTLNNIVSQMQGNPWRLKVQNSHHILSYERWQQPQQLTDSYSLGKAGITPENILMAVEAINFHLQTKAEQNIMRVSLGGNDIGDGFRNCQKEASWPHLVSLDIEQSNLGPQGMRHLAKLQIPRLQILYLWKNQIGSLGCSYMSNASWQNLQELVIERNDIGGKGCAYLSRASWSRLKYLNLGANKICAEGCLHLTKADWKQLEQLFLYWNEVRDRGCFYLSKTNWKKLTLLDLNGNQLTVKACQHLCKADWKHMQDLRLDSNKVTLGRHLINDKGWEDYYNDDVFQSI